jgi:hypothetical protein
VPFQLENSACTSLSNEITEKTRELRYVIMTFLYQVVILKINVQNDYN